MHLWLALAALLCGVALSRTEHTVAKRQTQYPQRGRPPQRFRTGFQVAPDQDEVVTEYVEQPYSQQQPPANTGNLRVSTSIRGSQQPSFTVTDEVDHQPPDYDQETPEPQYVLTTPRAPATPYGPQRRRPQYPLQPPPSDVLQGPRLTQQDLSPVSYATPRRPPQAPQGPPVAQIPPSNRNQASNIREITDEEVVGEEPAPPVPPAPARTVLISQGPVPSRPPLNFGGALLVSEPPPTAAAAPVADEPTVRPQRPRGPPRRQAARTTAAPPTTEQTPPPPQPSIPPRRAAARRPVVRLQNTQSNPTPPPTTRATPRAAAKRLSGQSYNPDSNLAPPPDEEELSQAVTVGTTRKFARKTTVATTEGPTTTPAPRTTTARRPHGKRLRINTLSNRTTTTSTTTELPPEYEDEEEEYQPPPPRRTSNNNRSKEPKPAVVFEQPSESQDEPEKQPVKFGNSARPTNKAFRPKHVEEDEESEEPEEPRPRSSRPSSSRGRAQQKDYDDDYDDGGTYRERLLRSRNNGNKRGRFRTLDNDRDSRSRGRPGKPTSPKPTRRVPPTNLPKRQDGRIIDYLGDPNFPRELAGYDLTEYPFYVVLPDDVGNFDCEERANGFYASVPHQCQVFHYCYVGNRFSFLCANYTLYDQTTFTCQFANKVNCITSERYYNRNDDLYKEKVEEKPKAKKEKPAPEKDAEYEDEEEEEVKEVKARSRGSTSGASAKNKS